MQNRKWYLLYNHIILEIIDLIFKKIVSLDSGKSISRLITSSNNNSCKHIWALSCTENESVQLNGQIQLPTAVLARYHNSSTIEIGVWRRVSLWGPIDHDSALKKVAECYRICSMQFVWLFISAQNVVFSPIILCAKLRLIL